MAIDIEVKEYVDQEMSKIYTTIDAITREIRGGFSGLEGRIAGLESRIGGLDHKMDAIDIKMNAVLHVANLMTDAYHRMERYLNELVDNFERIRKNLEGPAGYGKPAKN